MNSLKRILRLSAFSILLLCALGISKAQAASYLYAINDLAAGNQIYGFSVNETTGALTALTGFPVATGFSGGGSTNLEMITIDKLNRRLYVVNRGSNNISAYSINEESGALTALPFSPITGIANERIVEVHPSGSPLIVGGDDVASYVITATSATPAAGSPYPAGTNVSPAGGTFTRDGNYFYTGGNLGDFFAGFAVNPSTGVLTALPGSPYNSGNQTPNPTATDASGRLFVINSRQAFTRIYTTENGVPTPVTGNPFANGLASFASKGEVHPNGNFFMLGDRTGNRVGVYQISGTGAATTLAAIAGSPFATGGTSSLTLTFNEAGTFLFTGNGTSRNISTFSVNASTGELSNRVVLPANTLGAAGLVNGIAYVNFTPATVQRTPFDFDGDGKADVSVFRPSTGVWYLNQSTSGAYAVQFGSSLDRIMPGDYDGDGRTDIAVYRKNADSTWYILQSSDNTFYGKQWGATNLEQQFLLTDRPVPADYDGDGKTDLAVWRHTDFLSEPGYFLILQSSTNTARNEQWGTAFAKPVPADYDGDGKADLAVIQDGNVWYLKQSTAGLYAVQFGTSNDIHVPADYDGDGKDDIAVYRPSNGTWYLLQSRDGFKGVQFGAANDLPAPADYDGDGKTDVAVYREGVWYLNNSQTGSSAVLFGAANDRPVPSAFITQTVVFGP